MLSMYYFRKVITTEHALNYVMESSDIITYYSVHRMAVDPGVYASNSKWVKIYIQTKSLSEVEKLETEISSK